MTEPSAGMSRFVVKSKLGVGRDFEALGEDGQRAWFVDGKWGVKPAAEVQDAAGVVMYRLKGRFLGIPKQITISDAQGAQIASIRAKFSPVKSRMVIAFADGSEWIVEGNLIEKDYTITSAGAVVATISQKFLAVRDAYTLDVAAGVHPGLALSTLWAVDALREQR